MTSENPYEAPGADCKPQRRGIMNRPEFWRWILDRIALVVTAAVIFIIAMLFGLFFARPNFPPAP